MQNAHFENPPLACPQSKNHPSENSPLNQALTMAAVYDSWNICPTSAYGSWIRDSSGRRYLDLYGGHGVISVGHAHPHYVAALKTQIDQIAYYSNVVEIPLQKSLTKALQRLSGLSDYSLFLCNSGAEAVENCLRIASQATQKAKVLCFSNAFHGRTALAMALGDHPKFLTSLHASFDIVRIPFADSEALKATLDESFGAVIVEGIQGLAGVYEASSEWWRLLSSLCQQTGAKLIVDEVQSGCGRTGKFFSFQHHGIHPDLIAMAKGMGNGYPVAGVLATTSLTPKKGELGSTFGGHPLACAAATAVLEIMENDDLISHAAACETYLKIALKNLRGRVHMRGKGLMIGLQLRVPAAPVHKALMGRGILCGLARESNTLRILPPLSINERDLKTFLQNLTTLLK